MLRGDRQIPGSGLDLAIQAEQNLDLAIQAEQNLDLAIQTEQNWIY